jgi:hypothetical protein
MGRGRRRAQLRFGQLAYRAGGLSHRRDHIGSSGACRRGRCRCRSAATATNSHRSVGVRMPISRDPVCEPSGVPLRGDAAIALHAVPESGVPKSPTVPERAMPLAHHSVPEPRAVPERAVPIAHHPLRQPDAVPERAMSLTHDALPVTHHALHQPRAMPERAMPLTHDALPVVDYALPERWDIVPDDRGVLPNADDVRVGGDPVPVGRCLPIRCVPVDRVRLRSRRTGAGGLVGRPLKSTRQVPA